MSTKENPNPIIHSTNKHSHASNIPAAPLIGSAAIRRYNLGGSPSPSNSQQLNLDPTTEWNIDNTSSIYQWGSITAEDRSVALALSAAATTDNESNKSSSKLDILQQAGFALYNPKTIHKQCKAIRYPSFTPSKHKTKINIESTEWQTLHTTAEKEEEEEKRDTITPNEIFDIVRNIQDPEHPLTLEQLNVVRLELIKVADLKGDSSGNDSDNDDVTMEEDSSNQMNGHIRKKFSTVHVQFT
jgi:hypothetical protein